ncbi:hypothetical protein ABZ628_27610 [Streptomyces diastaticus]|uniref:ABC transporter permease n=2 Tax=Streptomyces TaxID=1883 RepID=A0ABX6RUX1_9ACTN|nr:MULTISPECIES: hypothetical protein [Streptomyces]NEE24424.1 hypothetical protein [Streptomyces sp. SID7982]PJM80307.1 hypothetical protein CH313_28980 [Streptomyces sp. TSRI0384-2]QNE79706.1 hypothetical protein F0345_00060 [Streptomyces rutgersensis]QNE84553.1 hypothetical protein F0345_28545 [Streptomyces rutgersensis]
MNSSVAFLRVLASEADKATSVRTLWWTVLGCVAAAAGTAFGLGLFARPGSGVSAASLAVAGYVPAQVGFLALGVTAGSQEFRTRLAYVTFAAVPRRLPVLAAQVVVTAVVALVAAVAALVASVAVTSGPREALGVPLDLAEGETVRMLAGFVLYQTAIALVGLGLGALLRRPAGALVTAVVGVVVLDQFLAMNPGRFTDTLRAFLPGTGVRLLTGDGRLAALDAASSGPHLETWAVGLLVAGWATALLLAAATRLRRGDIE